MPRTTEHGMVGNGVLNAELAKPPVRQIDLHLRAQPTFCADCKHVADDQHPDHQQQINLRPPGMRVIGRELLVHPTPIENGIDLSNQMIWRHYLVQIKRIKELTLPDFPPPHHEPPPSESPLQATKSRASDSLNESFATESPQKRTSGLSREMSALCQKRTFRTAVK